MMRERNDVVRNREKAKPSCWAVLTDLLVRKSEAESIGAERLTVRLRF